MRWLWGALFHHFWRKVEIIFRVTAGGVLFNVVEKAGARFFSDSLQIGWDTWNRIGDVVGTVSLWVVIPAGSVYLIGHNFHRYSRKRPKGPPRNA